MKHVKCLDAVDYNENNSPEEIAQFFFEETGKDWEIAVIDAGRYNGLKRAMMAPKKELYETPDGRAFFARESDFASERWRARCRR